MANEQVPVKRVRPVYTFDIPELSEPVDSEPASKDMIDRAEWQSIGMIELSADEELAASRKGGKDSFRIAYELARSSLVEVNGKKLDRMAGEDEKVWNTMPAALRNLIIEAYTEIHSPQEATRKGFLSSKKIRVA